MSSAQVTTRTGGLTLFSLSGELRNKIYRAYFDDLPDTVPPGNTHHCVPATTVRPFLNMFEVSQEVYAETHGLFFAEYFPLTRYHLEGPRAMQAFVKLPSEWRNDSHRLNFRSRDPDVGLEYLSTMEAVLGGTTGLETLSRYTKVSFEAPLGRDVMFLKPWDQEWEEMALSIPIYFPKERGDCKRHLPYAFIQATVGRAIFDDDPRSGNRFMFSMNTDVDNLGNTDWHFDGELSALDWSCVPEGVRLLVDKPVGDAITDEAAKAVRIIKGLEDLELGR